MHQILTSFFPNYAIFVAFFYVRLRLKKSVLVFFQQRIKSKALEDVYLNLKEYFEREREASIKDIGRS